MRESFIFAHTQNTHASWYATVFPPPSTFARTKDGGIHEHANCNLCNSSAVLLLSVTFYYITCSIFSDFAPQPPDSQSRAHIVSPSNPFFFWVNANNFSWSILTGNLKEENKSRSMHTRQRPEKSKDRVIFAHFAFPNKLLSLSLSFTYFIK